MVMLLLLNVTQVSREEREGDFLVNIIEMINVSRFNVLIMINVCLSVS